MPRTPCENLSAWIGIERFHRDFAASGRVGAMLAVLEPGQVSRGAPVVVVHRPGHRVTIADLATSSGVDRMPEMLAADVKLAAPVRAKARRLLTRHGGGDAR
jgi:MOSC domain-containing protein YiiM